MWGSERSRASLILSFLPLAILMAGCRGESPGDPASSGPLGDATSAPEWAPALERFVSDVMTDFEIPGLTLAVVQHGEMVYSRGFGVRDLESGEEMRPEYLFHFASVSKPFVATAIMQLVERGEMDLDAPVIDYLPYFELSGGAYDEITIRQMLDHTSGMPDVTDYEWDRPQTDDGAAERYVRSLSGQAMIAAPGESWRYSNMAFDTLGDVIAKVSGQPFERYVEEHILRPLRMQESTFLYPETRVELRTSPHVWRIEPVPSDVYPYNRRHAPSSTLNSSVVEMARWALANLGRGELDGVRILEDASYDVLFGPSAEVSDSTAVGLSWFLSQHRDRDTVGHSGGDTGYASQFLLVPEEELGVIMAVNYDNAPLGSLLDGVLDLVLGYPATRPKPSVALELAPVYLDEGIEAARSLYSELAGGGAESFVFGDRELNRLGYYFMGEGETLKAVEIFELNVELYPEVANCYDSLAEAVLAAGDEKRSIELYRRALEIDPEFTSALEALERLGVTSSSSGPPATLR